MAPFSISTPPRRSRMRGAARALSVPIESERRLYLFILTRFLHANRHPLRLKTLWEIASLRFGDTRRRRLGDELGGFQHGGAERRRNRHPERDQDAGSGHRREGDFDVALRREVFDHGAIGDVPRDRREIDRADHYRTLIALFGPYRFHPLVVEFKIVAHASVENGSAGAASIGVERIAGTGDPQHRI